MTCVPEREFLVNNYDDINWILRKKMNRWLLLKVKGLVLERMGLVLLLESKGSILVLESVS